MRIHLYVLSVLASNAMLLAAHAQTPLPPATRSPEVAVAYDLIGSNAPAGQCGCFVLNGGSLTGALPLRLRGVSLAGQFSATHAGNVNGSNYDLTLETYLAGLRYTMPLKGDRIHLFVQGLIGGSHASGSLVQSPNPGSGNAGFTVAGSIGGGLDVRWKRHVSIRALEVDYQPTTFDNSTTALENNYRISAGLVFRLR